MKTPKKVSVNRFEGDLAAAKLSLHERMMMLRQSGAAGAHGGSDRARNRKRRAAGRQEVKAW